jgi:hypothetical protein
VNGKIILKLHFKEKLRIFEIILRNASFDIENIMYRHEIQNASKGGPTYVLNLLICVILTT